jgi:hypothetical protein
MPRRRGLGCRGRRRPHRARREGTLDRHTSARGRSGHPARRLVVTGSPVVVVVIASKPLSVPASTAVRAKAVWAPTSPGRGPATAEVPGSRGNQRAPCLTPCRTRKTPTAIRTIETTPVNRQGNTGGRSPHAEPQRMARRYERLGPKCSPWPVQTLRYAPCPPARAQVCAWAVASASEGLHVGPHRRRSVHERSGVSVV